MNEIFEESISIHPTPVEQILKNNTLEVVSSEPTEVISNEVVGHQSTRCPRTTTPGPIIDTDGRQKRVLNNREGCRALGKTKSKDSVTPYYGKDTFQYLQQCEERQRPLPGYIETNQAEMTPAVRSFLVDWLVEVAEEYRLRNETLMLSIGYVDRFLSKERSRNMHRSMIQLVGITALLLASKIEEINPPHVDDFVFISDNMYDRREVLNMERMILDTLHYEMTQPTPMTFLSMILRSDGPTGPDHALHASFCTYLAEIAMLDYEVSTSFPSSTIAFSCVLLADFFLSRETLVLSSAMQFIRSLKLGHNYRLECLCQSSTLIFKRLKDNMVHSIFPAIHYKYTSSEFESVSKNWGLDLSLRAFEELPSTLFSEEKTPDRVEKSVGSLSDEEQESGYRKEMCKAESP